MPRPSKRKKRPPDKQSNAFLGKDLDYEGWKQIGKCDNMNFSKNWKFRQEYLHFSVSTLWQQVFRVLEQIDTFLGKNSGLFISESIYMRPFPCQMCEKSLFLCNYWCFCLNHRPFHVRKYILPLFPMPNVWKEFVFTLLLMFLHRTPAFSCQKVQFKN